MSWLTGSSPWIAPNRIAGGRGFAYAGGVKWTPRSDDRGPSADHELRVRVDSLELLAE